MKRLPATLSALLGWVCSAAAQYAPQAGQPGSTAVHRYSGAVSGWATGCTVQRGWQDIGNPSAGLTTTGSNASGIGPADGDVVSLGDSGVAVLTFAQPLQDAPGADFAVFENGFLNPADAREGYLELAFVEVSSDGQHFFRFPAASATQTSVQIAGTGDYMNAARLHNLAGKYAAPYGTPFDLADLQGRAGLDVQAITHIRIVDVVGTLGRQASRDDSGRIVNDPYPTPFATGGFDLDGVAVLHGSGTSVANASDALRFAAYPQPAGSTVTLSWDGRISPALSVSVIDMTGRVVLPAAVVRSGEQLALGQLGGGFYLLKISEPSGFVWTEKIQVLR